MGFVRGTKGGVHRGSSRDQSLPKSSFPSSTKLISTTTADPIIPRKNIASSTRIATTATIMCRFYRNPNALHSPLYAIFLEAVGRRRTFRGLARVALSLRRPNASVALRLCLVCSRSSALGSPLCREFRPHAFSSPRFLHLL